MLRSRRDRRRDQRGATGVLVALVMAPVLVVSAAFAVDLGQQRVVRGDMQAVADVGAMDLARRLDGSTVSGYQAADFTTALAESIKRNDDSYGDRLTSAPCAFPRAKDSVAVPGEVGACWEFVKTGANGWTRTTSSSDIPEAVRVFTKSKTGFAFGGVTGIRSGGAFRQAVASAETSACFALGSYAAQLRSGDSALLGPLLGDTLGLGAVGYQGLLNLDATVPLVDIAIALDAGTADELADTSVTLGDFYLAVAEALKKNGDAVSAKLIEDAVALGITQLPPIKVGDIIGLAQGADAALSSEIDVLDLITTSALIANGTNAVSLPDLGVNSLPILGTAFTSSLNIIEKPQTACGGKGTVQETSQIDLDLTGTVANLNTSAFPLLGPLLGALADVKVGLGATLALDGAYGKATLTELSCAPPMMKFGMQGALAKTTLNVPVVITANLLGALGVKVAEVRIGFIARINNPAGPLSQPEITLEFPPKQYNVPYAAGSSALGLQEADISLDYNPAVSSTKYVSTHILLPLLGYLVDPIVNALLGNIMPIATAVLRPLVTGLNNLVLGPLGDLTGLSVAGVDVLGLKKPRCGRPSLRG